MDIKVVLDLLEEINNDRTVPRNVRAKVSEVIEMLKNLNKEKEKRVKLNSAAATLDELSNDPNIPIYTRTQIWNILSLLETMSRELKD